jgi:hypothetical protein
MTNILVYYNALNLNAKKGIDFERTGYFNIGIGFF